MVLVLNGVTTHYHGGEATNMAIAGLLSIIIARMPQQSMASIQESAKMATEMANEILVEEWREELDGREKAKKSRLISRLSKLSESVSNTSSKDKAISMVCDVMLALEGMNTLPGFGFKWTIANQMHGNPEKVTMRSFKPA
jgi:hypothetical protein